MDEFYDSFLVAEDHREAGLGADVTIANCAQNRFAIRQLSLHDLARRCERLCHDILLPGHNYQFPNEGRATGTRVMGTFTFQATPSTASTRMTP